LKSRVVISLYRVPSNKLTENYFYKGGALLSMLRRPSKIFPCRAWGWDQMERSLAIILNEISNPPFYSKRARRREKWKDTFTDAEVYAKIEGEFGTQIVKYKPGTTRKELLETILGCWGMRGYAIAFSKLRGLSAKTQTEEFWGENPNKSQIFCQAPMINGKRFKCCLDTSIQDFARKAEKRLDRCEEYYYQHEHDILQKEPLWDEYTVVYQTYVIEREMSLAKFKK